ncbi:MAG: cytochrome bc complex cytochrome b subunit, partial [Deltaproteobacteria bacterium]|nr:cytochrome bc complex cytochrome b subunit [Deltaproteobacteria bacterium]
MASNSFFSLLLHIHPPKVPESTIAFRHTWGLGGMAALLVCFQVITGILLLFVYQPVPEQAYASIILLQ